MTYTLPKPAGFTAGNHDAALFSLKRSTAKNFAIGSHTELFEWHSPAQMQAVYAAGLATTVDAEWLARRTDEAYQQGLRAAPEGWKLVPIEPTPEMIAAAVKAMYTHAFSSDEDEASQLLADGIAAAQEPLK